MAFIGLVLWDAFRMRWLSDDAFISFRYAKNWAEGSGLVYNAGEYVEGYTNLLWTLILGLGMMGGISPELLSHLLSLGALVTMLFALTKFSSKNVWILGSMFHIRIFATSGLETQWFLTTISLLMVGLWEGRWRLAIISMILGMLLRPEGGLLWFGLVTALMISQLNKPCKAAIFSGFLTLIGIELWRYFYYGDWLPNTFHAKASESQWSQGWLYIRLFFQMYWFVPFGWLIAISQLRHSDERIRRLAVFTVVFATLFIVHVLRSGGDFMMARFALPWAVPLVVSLALWIQERTQGFRIQWWIPVLGASVALTSISPDGLTDSHNGQFGIGGITEEHIWYTEEWREKAEIAGREVRPFLEDTDIKVVIYGAQAMFAYYANLPYALEGMTGLTDRELATFSSRDGRVGHGRKATVPYLQQRGIDLYIDFRLQQGSHPLNQIQIGSVSGSILCYKKESMDVLRSRGAQFVDFPLYLSQYMNTIMERTPSELQRDLSIFEGFYFQFNQTLEDKKIQDQLVRLTNSINP